MSAIVASASGAVNMMNSMSSVFSRGLNFSSLINAPLAAVGNAATDIVSKIFGFFYFIIKWVLYFIDIIFSYVQQLCGLNMDLSSIEAATSGDSDLIFNFLWAQSDFVTRLARSLIIIAAILIILFSILAVVKTQFESLSNGTPADIKMVFRNMLKSFVLLIITPLAAILGIIASDVILQTLYRATNVSESATLSTQIFVASSASANSFKLYAENNQRVPIVYNFENEKAILDYYSDKESNSAFLDYLTSSSNAIYTTYLMFEIGNFVPYDSLRREDDTNAYHAIYDIGSTANAVGDRFAEFRRIENYASEYFVMADVVEFCIRSTTPVYYKTIDEILLSASTIPNIGDREVQNLIDTYNIHFYSNANSLINIGLSKYGEFRSRVGRIEYTSKYYGANDVGEPTNTENHTYNHIMGELDEVEGAKYIITTERKVKVGDTEYTYYYPLTSGSVGLYGVNFKSEYIGQGQLISAKGIFEGGRYPTAIRQDDEGNILFYRDKIEDCYTGEFGNLAGLDYQNGESGGFFGKMKMFFSSFFNPASIVPNLSVDTTAIANTYTSNLTTVNTLKGGRLHIGYMFSDWLTTGLLKGNFTLNIENLYQPLKINYLILFSCTFLLIKVVFSAVVALINRLYELFLIILFYPSACATIPLTNEGYNNWFKSYLSRLLSTYGIILGINFLFILFPVISTIEVFNVETVATRRYLQRFTKLFFGSLTVSKMTNMLNFACTILFEVVAFTFIQKIPEVIDGLVGGKSPNAQNNPLESLAVGVANMTAAGRVFKMVTGKTIGAGKKVLTAKGREELKGKMMEAIPMSQVVSAAKDRKNLSDKKKAQKEAENDLQEALDDPSNFDSPEGKKLIQERLNALAKAQKNYTSALKDPHGSRKAAEQEKKDEEDSGLTSRADDDLDENNIDVSDLSTKDIKKRNKKAKKVVKYLNKKAKKQGLTEEERASLETYTNVKEATKNEKKSRRGEGRELARLRMGRLTSRLGGKKTDPDAIQKDADRKARLEEIKNTRQDRKTTSKNKRKEIKERNKTAKKVSKQTEKQNKKEKKENEKFKRTGVGSKRSQNRALKKYDKNSDKITKGLYATGFDASKLETMTDEELNDQIVNANKHGNTSDQVALLQEYQRNMTRQQELMGINTTAIENKQGMKTVKRQFKDNDIAGYTGRGRRKNATVKKRTRQSADTSDTEAEYDNIQAQIDALKSGGLKSNRDRNKYRKLTKQAAKKKSSIDQANNWNDMNTAEHYEQRQAEIKKYNKGYNNLLARTEELYDSTGEFDEDEIHKRAVKHSQARKKKKNKDE